LPGLTIQCIGARTPDELRNMAAQKLGCKFLEGYGANEIGAIGEVDNNGMVTLRDEVEAQIMDGETILPPGEIGTLRFRANTLIAGYMNNAQATETMFRDGWFYPGDLGSMTPDGKLRLIGRRADVLNLGGIKVGAADLEGRLLDFPGLLDVALIQPSTLTDSMQVTVAVVIPEHFNIKAFAARITSALNYPFTIIPVPAIPRTTEGKIQRAALQEMLLSDPPAAVARKLETANSH
jgi:acyl-coenzyme A synthetase/AMP-(fatty) acid ligase